MPNNIGWGVPTLGRPLGRRSGGGLQYWQRVKNLFGANLIGYWPMWETSGVTSEDISGNSRNGTYRNTAGALNGVTLAAMAGPNGRIAASFNGTGFNNIYSATLASAFNGAEGALSIFAMIDSVNTWTDGAAHYFARFRVDASNDINFSKTAVNNQIALLYNAGGGNKIAYLNGASSTGWMNCLLTWSASGNVLRGYANNAQIAEGQSIGTWAGVPASTFALFGANSTSPSTGWKGGLSDAFLLNRFVYPDEACRLFGLNYRLAVIGDSIPAAAGSFAQSVADQWRPGTMLINHAVAGNSISANMATQVTLAADNKADVIILQLGTNDNDAGDMTALQTTLETQIAALKVSNPNATLIYMGVLPRWTDATGATPVDKSHIRSAQLAACQAQGITYWDTYTAPWITAAQTSDGTHPTTAGHQAIAMQVLARM